MDDVSYGRSAAAYDALYEAMGRDVAAEAAVLDRLVRERRPGARSLLDVACGTGAHLLHLAARYEVAGVDLSPHMLARAAARLPGALLVEADMRTFDLGRRFDAATCLFSAIAYMPTVGDLDAAVANVARHLHDGGVLVVDGWVRPADWIEPGTVQALAAHADGTAAARVVRSSRDGRVSRLELHHLLATVEGVEHLREVHELTLFEDADYRRAFERAGFDVEVVESPYPTRDRYVGVLHRQAD